MFQLVYLRKGWEINYISRNNSTRLDGGIIEDDMDLFNLVCPDPTPITVPIFDN